MRFTFRHILAIIIATAALVSCGKDKPASSEESDFRMMLRLWPAHHDDAVLSEELLNALKEGTKNGKVIVNVSQCLQGAVEMSRYDCGYHLQEAGVISGHDMTVESAVTKLMYLQSHFSDDPDTVRSLMQKSIRGEMTI